MKRKNAANFVMVAVIGLMAAAGMAVAGYILGWFDQKADAAVLGNVRGVVNMERGSIVYPLEEETALRAGDRITCDAGASAEIRWENGIVVLGSGAEICVEEAFSYELAAEVLSGEVFVDATGTAALSFDGRQVIFENTAAFLSVRMGAQSVYVFDGVVEGVQAGQKKEWVRGAASVGEMEIQTLNEFVIHQIRQSNRKRSLCFSNDQLDELELQRLAAINAQLVSEDGDGLYCTIAIYCDTILDNLDSLDTAKASFVPQNGVILPPTVVEFSAGETVFDVLQRVCQAHEIQIEYSWTPLYDSYYVEGIHNLYEFDCGFQSGWMYKVNEWFPNYGCSAYRLTGGESIVWCYTCNGLGEDVGGSSY